MLESDEINKTANTNQIDPTKKLKLLPFDKVRLALSFALAIVSIPIIAGLIMAVANVFPQILAQIFVVLFIVFGIFRSPWLSSILLFIAWWSCVYISLGLLKKIFTAQKKMFIFFFISILLFLGVAYITGLNGPAFCGPTSTDCDEIRPLPKILQNKKIVFDNNANIEFDPLNDSGNGTLGIIEVDYTDPKITGETIVEPTSRQRGYLANREYTILQAIYHHKCALCIDSSDYGYIVIQDYDGNKFESFLNDLNFTATSTSNVPWDKQVPFYLENTKNSKAEARLENIN